MSFRAGNNMGKHTVLTAFFDDIAKDGKITENEGNQLASRMGMDPNTFWAKFDLNNNRLMTGDELQAAGDYVGEKEGAGKYVPPGG